MNGMNEVFGFNGMINIGSNKCSPAAPEGTAGQSQILSE